MPDTTTSREVIMRAISNSVRLVPLHGYAVVCRQIERELDQEGFKIVRKEQPRGGTDVG